MAMSRKPTGRTVIATPEPLRTEATTVDDLKAGYRETKDDAKEAWRKADGKEDLGDKVGNLGDDIRRGIGNAGDQLDDGVDEHTRNQPTEEPRGV
jgi:hypothetical protein